MQRHADEEVLHLFARSVPLGHIVAGGKALIVDFLPVYLVPVDEKPVEIAGSLPVLQHIAELQAPFADVVEYGIQDDVKSRLVRRLHEFTEVFLPAEHLIDRKVILGVVFMIAHRLKDGRQIERVDAKFFEIRQLFRNTFEISARKAFGRGQFSPRKRNIGIVFFLVAAEEAVDEDLIKPRIPHPLHGAMDIRRVEISDLVIVGLSPFPDAKDIDKAHVGNLQLRRIIVEKAVGTAKAHGFFAALSGKIILSAVEHRNFRGILLCRPQPQRHAVFGESICVLRLRFVIHCLFLHTFAPRY